MDVNEHRENLERVLETLWHAYDGDRRIKHGDRTPFTESAAPLAKQIRETLAELAQLAEPEGKSASDRLRKRIAAANSAA